MWAVWCDRGRDGPQRAKSQQVFIPAKDCSRLFHRLALHQAEWKNESPGALFGWIEKLQSPVADGCFPPKIRLTRDRLECRTDLGNLFLRERGQKQSQKAVFWLICWFLNLDCHTEMWAWLPVCTHFKLQFNQGTFRTTNFFWRISNRQGAVRFVCRAVNLDMTWTWLLWDLMILDGKNNQVSNVDPLKSQRATVRSYRASQCACLISKPAHLNNPISCKKCY